MKKYIIQNAYWQNENDHGLTYKDYEGGETLKQATKKYNKISNNNGTWLIIEREFIYGTWFDTDKFWDDVDIQKLNKK